MTKKEIVAVLGAGNMGTAIAQIVASNGFRVNLWNYEGEAGLLESIKEKSENIKYLPGIKLSENINCEPDISKAVVGASVIFMVVPSGFIKNIAKKLSPHLSSKSVCVDVSKGLDLTKNSYALITDILKKYFPKNKIVAISGPAVARDMVAGNFTAMSAASKDRQAVKIVKKVLENDSLKLNFTNDIIGTEAAGSFKNVYAIAVGMADGIGLSMNTKSVLLTKALAEMSLLIKKIGGKSETIYGLAGLGDLVGTSLAARSRNRRLGECLAKGLNLNEAMAQVGQVTEGVAAVKILMMLSRKYKLNTPLAGLVYRVVYKKSDPKKEISNFLKGL